MIKNLSSLARLVFVLVVTSCGSDPDSPRDAAPAMDTSMTCADAGEPYGNRWIASATPSADGLGYCCPVVFTSNRCGCEQQSTGGFALTPCECGARAATECFSRLLRADPDAHGCSTTEYAEACF